MCILFHLFMITTKRIDFVRSRSRCLSGGQTEIVPALIEAFKSRIDEENG